MCIVAQLRTSIEYKSKLINDIYIHKYCAYIYIFILHTYVHNKMIYLLFWSICMTVSCVGIVLCLCTLYGTKNVFFITMKFNYGNSIVYKNDIEVELLTIQHFFSTTLSLHSLQHYTAGITLRNIKFSIYLFQFGRAKRKLTIQMEISVGL